jgi:RNA recognition motif-containing protein
MRIDPKYFNRFIAICAAITVVVIIYSTFRYFERQVTDFNNNVSEIQPDTLSFRSFSNTNRLYLNNLPDEPMVIHFWSTWSDKSIDVGDFFRTYSKAGNQLIVIAAAVRDGDEQVRDYVKDQSGKFHFVEGTDLFQSVPKDPGITCSNFH